MRNARRDGGFTLIEIMAAVAILGTGLLVLLDAHYAALRLFNDTREAVLMQGFLERALGQAEVEVMMNELEGSGDFGKRYPDYSFSFTAQPLQEEDETPLFLVLVTVKGPGDTRSMEMLVYNLGM